MSSGLKGILFCCLAAFQPNGGQTAEFFVSPFGAEWNDGSEVAPWPSIGYALNHVNGGNVITALPGTYLEAVVVEISGTAGNPTVIRSQQKWDAVILDSPSHGIYVADGVTNVVIDGFQVVGSAEDGVKIGSQATVRNCWIHHSSGQGITAHRTQGVLIERNLVELNGSDPVFDHGIYLSGTNNIVRSCVIRWNRCYGCQFYSEPPDGSAECRFYNNLVYGNRNALAIWSAFGCTNYVFNNSMMANRYVLRADSGFVCVTNNILIGPSARRIFSGEHDVEFRADYNVISATGRRRGSHDVMVSDPRFINTSNGLFWLAAESPARGAASEAALPAVDFFGNAQTQSLDAGAFQYRAEFTADTRTLDPSPAKPDYWQTNVAAGLE